MSVELENHLTLNLKRLRTFEFARLEIATCVEAKIGLIIRGSQQSESGAGGQSDPMHVDAISSLASVKSTRWLFQGRWKQFSKRLHCSCHTTQRQPQESLTEKVMVQECWQTKGQRR